MRVRALRGVCIGVDRHLQPGDAADLEAAQVEFLVGIGAVERIADAPPVPAAEAPQSPVAASAAADQEPQAPARPGKKEK